MGQGQLRNAKEKVLRRLALRLKTSGFVRTKPTFYVRPRGAIIEFVHLHKYTFEASFRPHIGLRVINDSRDAVALNGPTSDAYQGASSHTDGQHDFSFDASEAAIDRCAQNLAEFIHFYAESWFASWQDETRLVDSHESPLDPSARRALARALAGERTASLAATTRRLLNVA